MPEIIAFLIRRPLSAEKMFMDCRVSMNSEFTKNLNDPEYVEALKTMAPESANILEAFDFILGSRGRLRVRFNSDMDGPYLVQMPDGVTPDDVEGYINSIPHDEAMKWLNRHRV